MNASIEGYGIGESQISMTIFVSKDYVYSAPEVAAERFWKPALMQIASQFEPEAELRIVTHPQIEDLDYSAVSLVHAHRIGAIAA